MPPLGRRKFQKFLLLGLAGSGLGLLAACGPKEYFLSQAQLLERLEKHFPLEKNLFGLTQLRLHNPTLQLNPQAQRLGGDLVLSLQPMAWAGTTRSLDAHLGLSCALRFDASRMALVLADVAMERLDFAPVIEGANVDEAKANENAAAWAKYAPMLRSFVAQWLPSTLENYPIYTLPENAQKWLGQDSALEIKILNNGVLFKRL